ncbi:hypothetical protein E2C01_065574 [Portunus trituberculatus]|uniref:Uncharacterized protein n=1 Tax=Portunus trituberculatus TaxID=210409 RepID=A0A5B7HFX5_PORTR|nr:hypothetical protein [Portunus trituberculatus]
MRPSVMQCEASLVHLTTRVQQIITCCVARVMLRDTGGTAQKILWLALMPSVMTWLLEITLPTGRPPCPQISPSAPVGVLHSSLLYHAAKAHCTTMELGQHTLVAMTQVAKPDNAVYFKHSLADQDRGRRRLAITSRTEYVARTPTHCSILQIKLVAIQQSGARQPLPGCHRSSSHILGSLQSITKQGQQLKLNWIPNRVGVVNIEAHDAAVRRATMDFWASEPVVGEGRRSKAHCNPAPPPVTLTTGGNQEAGGMVHCHHCLSATQSPQHHQPKETSRSLMTASMVRSLPLQEI